MGEYNNPQYDVAIALGKNWGPNKRPNSKPKRLSLESRMTALAAGKLLKDKVVGKIIFSGGYTAGNEMPSEAKAMQNYMDRSYRNKAEEVYLEDKSLDTSRNAENIKDLIKEKDNVLLLSVGYHFPRAKRIFNNYGIKADIISSEEVLSGNDSRMDRFLKNYHGSFRHFFETAKETLILNPISWVDKKGLALRYVTSLLRKRK